MTAKFDKNAVPTPARILGSTTEERVYTHEGFLGWAKEPRSELFLSAVVNMVSEDTFYESASERDSRFKSLVHQVTKDDPEWVARFVPYLRNEMYMRSVSIVMAAEYVHAGGPNGRSVINSACARADEPAELLAYWSNLYGKAFPMPLKRGVADAVNRLYNEYSALKYDGGSRNWRMGDVIELVHPKPADDRRSALFGYLLDRRHHPNAPRLRERDALPIIHGVREWEATEPAPLALPPGVTWERLSGRRKMDKDAWESVIPQMGYMALLRNLRNFDEAGVSEPTAAAVGAKLSEPDEVSRSKQFPIRFYSAYRNVTSERWGATLEKALDLSLENVPAFPGSTAIFIDVSGSMGATISNRSSITLNQLSSLFGGAVAKRSDKAKVVAFGTESADITNLLGKRSLLRFTNEVHDYGNRLGWGTNAYPAIANHYNGEDRVMIFTDMQVFPAHGTETSIVDQIKNLYVFDLGGYGPSGFQSDRPGRYTLGGLTDKTFKMLELLEKTGRSEEWPF